MGKKTAAPTPTESELAILQILWRKGPSSVREVWQDLGQSTGYTTVLKFLQIMLEKKLVKRNESRMTHIYEAAVTKSSTQDRLLQGLIHGAFSGSSGQLVLRALSDKSVPPEELKMIRSLIAERKDGKP